MADPAGGTTIKLHQVEIRMRPRADRGVHFETVTQVTLLRLTCAKTSVYTVSYQEKQKSKLDSRETVLSNTSLTGVVPFPSHSIDGESWITIINPIPTHSAPHAHASRSCFSFRVWSLSSAVRLALRSYYPCVPSPAPHCPTHAPGHGDGPGACCRAEVTPLQPSHPHVSKAHATKGSDILH